MDQKLKTVRHRPAIPTTTTPESIIGPGNMMLFKDHYVMSSEQGEYQHKKLDKAFGEDRINIAETYRKLRENGFYVVGLDKYGGLRWVYACQSAVISATEKYEPFDVNISELSTNELRIKARALFSSIGSHS